jgi:SnoaL-like polyketide cyclase
MPNRDLNAILQLWTRTLPKPEHLRAFAEHYTDPVIVNGTPLSLDAMVDRAQAQQRALSDIEMVMLEQIDTEDRSIIAFRQRGRHTGPLATPLGEVPATGKIIERQVIDILRFEGSRVCHIYVVADELGGLLQLGAVALKVP